MIKRSNVYAPRPKLVTVTGLCKAALLCSYRTRGNLGAYEVVQIAT